MFEHTRWLEDQPIFGTARTMMFVLCNKADANGRWDFRTNKRRPGRDEWAWLTGVQERAIRTGIITLCDAGLLSICGVSELGLPVYQLHMIDLPEAVLSVSAGHASIKGRTIAEFMPIDPPTIAVEETVWADS